MAESSIPNAGLRVFAGTSFQKRENVDVSPQAVIPLIDLNNSSLYIESIISNYLWTGLLLQAGEERSLLIKAFHIFITKSNSTAQFFPLWITMKLQMSTFRILPLNLEMKQRRKIGKIGKQLSGIREMMREFRRMKIAKTIFALLLLFLSRLIMSNMSQR